jgi:predicted SAM-dependent methyltransferase
MGKALSNDERQQRFAKNQERFKEKYGETGTNWDEIPRYSKQIAISAETKKLNLGSFQDTFGSGWTNIDVLNVRPYIPADHLFKQWDLRRGIPYADDSVALIRMSHLIEHLTMEEGKALLREIYRVLRPAGLVRIATPDARTIIRHFIRDDMSFFNAVEQPPEYIMAKTQCEKLSMILFSLDYSHRVLYDFDMLKDYLQQAGFSKVFRSVAGFSHSEAMQTETKDQHIEISLLVEAVK